MRTLPTTEYETKKLCGYAELFLSYPDNDNRLDNLRFQGGYLYDKGENDEQFLRFGSSTDLQVYFIMLMRKCKPYIETF